MASNPLATTSGSQLIAKIPALAPPEGVIPDFEHPATHISIAVVWGSIELVLMLFFYTIRLYNKYFITRKFTWDDLTCTFGVVGVVTYLGAILLGCINGPIGKHQYEIFLGDILNKNFMIISCLATALGALPLLAVKLTFFILYLHLFRPMRALSWCIYVGAVLTTIFYGGVILGQVILCSPSPGETWIQHLFSEADTKAAKLSVPIGAVGLATDTYILILPIVGVLRLQMSSRKKLGTCLIFLTGLLACVAASVSLYYRVVESRTDDLTWFLFDVQFLNATEIFVGIICSCMPSVFKTIQHHQEHLQIFASKFRSRSIMLRSLSSNNAGHSDNNSGSNPKRLSVYYNLDVPPHATCKQDELQVQETYIGHGDGNASEEELGVTSSLRHLASQGVLQK